jgi:hypothetical protein
MKTSRTLGTHRNVGVRRHAVVHERSAAARTPSPELQRSPIFDIIKDMMDPYWSWRFMRNSGA